MSHIDFEQDPLNLDAGGNEPAPPSKALLAHAERLIDAYSPFFDPVLLHHVEQPKGKPPSRVIYGNCNVTVEATSSHYLVRRASSRYVVSLINGAVRYIDWLKPNSEPVRVLSHGKTFPAHLNEIITACKVTEGLRTWRPGCGW